MIKLLLLLLSFADWSGAFPLLDRASERWSELVPVVAEQPRPDRVLLFTFDACAPCRETKRRLLPELERRGWTVGEQDDARLQIVDIYDDPEGLVEKYRTTQYPTLIRVDADGREISRTVGQIPGNGQAAPYSEFLRRLSRKGEQWNPQ